MLGTGAQFATIAIFRFHQRFGHDYLTIGQTAKRAGVATSALRFHEERGLVESIRGSGNQRRFHRSALRRISIIKVAQTLGLTLNEISDALAALPNGRTPTARDWQKLSNTWRANLDERIRQLELLRDQLTSCIGWGCLSLKRCTLYNAEDKAAKLGQGAQYWRPAHRTRQAKQAQ